MINYGAADSATVSSKRRPYEFTRNEDGSSFPDKVSLAGVEGEWNAGKGLAIRQVALIVAMGAIFGFLMWMALGLNRRGAQAITAPVAVPMGLLIVVLASAYALKTHWPALRPGWMASVFYFPWLDSARGIQPLDEEEGKLERAIVDDALQRAKADVFQRKAETRFHEWLLSDGTVVRWRPYRLSKIQGKGGRAYDKADMWLFTPPKGSVDSHIRLKGSVAAAFKERGGPELDKAPVRVARVVEDASSDAKPEG
jgi:hypothetical protein